MSLSTREQRALESIEGMLSGSDPGLASRLATFTRLTSAEEMPAREKILVRERLRGARRSRPDRQHLAPRRVCRQARRLYQRLGRQLAGQLLWLLAVAGLIAFVLVASRGSPGACTDPWPLACARHAPTLPGPGSRPTSPSLTARSISPTAPWWRSARWAAIPPAVALPGRGSPARQQQPAFAGRQGTGMPLE